MTKRNHQQGQISIFFSASLVVLVSIIAFVVNVGLFVKAKINLQNSTDAAAFAGAAVQARQLTKIAYLNWEMRNIYKEWMYKYYVIGNLNIEDVKNANAGSPGSNPTNYRMLADRNAITGVVTPDPYNLPAVCIHLQGSQTNICRRYAIPGLPEFGSSNLPGAEEASRAFMDTLIGTKINDCIDRTKLNMLVAASWAFNVLAQGTDDTLAGRGPAVLADRQGAWPRAVELAMRIRNLEFVMNRPAQTERFCKNPGFTDKIGCSKSIQEISDENKLGNERIVKAFYSGYRNMGGSYEEDEMKNSFTLTEIPPRAVTPGNATSASYLLVPSSKAANYPKQFVDLKLMMANFAIFYAAMIPRADQQVSGACDVTKAAIPVPGYPLGYYKNPDLVTYYAVRGEAVFTGMFNPFSEDIKLTTYSAAKPFGGRIGPMLFTQEPNSSEFYGRKDTEKRRSVPYLSTLDVVGTPKRGGGNLVLGEYMPGVPLPINASGASFWLNSPASPIGGLVTDSEGVQFGIPNLVYDYEVPFRDTNYTTPTDPIHVIRPASPISADQKVGLYSQYQLGKFKGNLGTSVTPQDLDHEIARVRAPTLYEAANYLVPTPYDLNIGLNVDSFGFAGGVPQDLPNGVKRYQNFVYAPLYKSNDQTDVLFETQNEVVSTIFDFMRAQKSGINKYKNALNKGAVAIYKMGRAPFASSSAAGAAQKYEQAAEGVSDLDWASLNMSAPDPDVSAVMPKSCKSIAGQFLYFYYGAGDLEGNGYIADNSSCPTPLGDLLQQYFASTALDANYSKTHYKFDYSWYPNNFPTPLGAFTAYTPGTFTGVREDGNFVNPIPGSSIQETMRRNFYSTKFVALDSLKNGERGYAQNSTNFLIFSEGDTGSTNLEVKQRAFENYLEPLQIGSDNLDSIKH